MRPLQLKGSLCACHKRAFWRSSLGILSGIGALVFWGLPSHFMNMNIPLRIKHVGKCDAPGRWAAQIVLRKASAGVTRIAPITGIAALNKLIANAASSASSAAR